MVEKVICSIMYCAGAEESGKVCCECTTLRCGHVLLRQVRNDRKDKLNERDAGERVTGPFARQQKHPTNSHKALRNTHTARIRSKLTSV